MSKILITGDVHINDFRSHNLFGDSRFRLKQFIKLAQRIVNISKDQDADTLVIAGDFLHVCSPRPYIVNTAFEFLDIITEHMDVYLTHGQHDYDARALIEGENTLLTICERIPKVHYLHKQSVNIEGINFYFLGWEPNWNEYVRSMPSADVLVGHASPTDVSIGQHGNKTYGGVDLHNGLPFRIAFLGDIHYHQTRDNWVIPGTPIQHSFNDKPEVGIISFNPRNFDWVQIPTICRGSWDFLQMVITDELSDNPFVVTRRKTTTQSEDFKREIEGSIDVLQVIQTEVERNDLVELHEQLMNHIPKEVRDDVVLDFSIDHVKITNFRSIEEFEWNKVDKEVNLLVGENGAGKTSLVSAIMFGLTGEGDARRLTRIGSKKMEIELDVTYGGLQHTIRRGWSGSGKTQYLINGENQDAENQKELKKRIESNLKFLKMMDLVYHQQDSPGFLASYNYSARVELISRVLGLKILDELHQAAQQKIVGVERELSTLREKLASVTAVVEQESLVDFSIMETFDDATETNLQVLRDRIQETLEEERDKYQKASKAEATLTSRLERATSDVSKAYNRRKRLCLKECYTCGQSIGEQEYKTLLSSVEEEITERNEEILNIQRELDTLEKISNELVKKLESRLAEIQVRLGEFSSKRQQAKSLQKLKIAIDEAKKKATELDEELCELKKRKDTLLSYKKLMEANGLIMRALLTEVSSILSSESIQVRAFKTLVSGELRPDFGVDMNVKGNWISYDELSGGQKTVADLAILEKLISIVGGIGLLVFDETFHDLDLTNLEKVVDLLKGMQCRTTFIISHTENFPYYDAQIQASMDENGATTYSIW